MTCLSYAYLLDIHMGLIQGWRAISFNTSQWAFLQVTSPILRSCQRFVCNYLQRRNIDVSMSRIASNRTNIPQNAKCIERIGCKCVRERTKRLLHSNTLPWLAFQFELSWIWKGWDDWWLRQEKYHRRQSFRLCRKVEPSSWSTRQRVSARVLG